MGYLMTATDILELAMQLEKSGEVFYRAVAKQSESPETQAVLKDLAKQEVEHYEVFAKLARTVRDSPPSASDWEEYVGYVNTTVHGAFFQGPDKALAEAERVKGEKGASR